MSNGRWKPGQTGNPKGRPKGTGKIAELRQAIESKVPAIIKQLTEAALSGDVGAARLLLERAIPPLRAAEDFVEIKLAGESIADHGRAVIAAAAGGNLSPSQASSMLSSLGALARIVEADELIKRIEALELKHGLRPKE